MSLNAWLYVYANPINFMDPSGNVPQPTDYDETKPPSGIQFFPAQSIPTAFIYEGWDPNGNQRIAPAASRVPPGTYGSQLKIRNEWNYLCGQVAISAVLRLTDPYMTANEVAYSSKDIAMRLTGPSDLTNIVNQNYAISWQALQPGWGYWTDYTNHKRFEELPNDLHNWLASSSYPIMSVEIQCGGASKNCGRIGDSGSDIKHWIVVTGITSDWDADNSYSDHNWIRIYNPFDNQIEYYTYEDFQWGISTYHGGGMMTLMSRVGPALPSFPWRVCK
jgi:hypothetical protein